METVRLESLDPRGWPPPAVTVGNFDGVHRGHQALVSATLEAAREMEGRAVVLTFDPHPARVLFPDSLPSALMTPRQKAEILAELGVKALAVLPFTAAVAALSPEAFVRDVLLQALRARKVVVGETFRFGRGRAGDVAVLRRLGRELGFEVDSLPPVLEGGAPVSSSRVRDALAAGDVALARELLGRPFFVDGRVVRGEGRGRGLGIPTANLETENETLPGGGVYAGYCRLARGAVVPSVVNLGRRPTFGAGGLALEAHLLDFEGDLYGAALRLEFHHRLREERRFESVPALLAQIGDDVSRARLLLSGPPTGTV